MQFDFTGPSVKSETSPLTMAGGGAASNWEDLRKQARNLENDIDVKLVAFSKVGAGGGGGGGALQADTVPLLSADDMFETMAMEIQQLINKLGNVNDKMSELPSTGPAMLHTRQRHRDILQDYQQEFRKTQGNWISRREREDLLRGSESGTTSIGGLSRRDQYTKESTHLHSSHHMVDEQINIAMDTREHLISQRHSFKKFQTRFNDISNRFPAINSLIHRINSRKKRDSLIVGIVVGVCTFLMLLYAFN